MKGMNTLPVVFLTFQDDHGAPEMGGVRISTLGLGLGCSVALLRL